MSVGLNVTTFWQPTGGGSFPTHIDIYGQGGFVAISTTTDLPLINEHITPARRKEGMLVYDVTTSKYSRCISVLEDPNDNNWVEENFGGSSAINITEGPGIDVSQSGSDYTISLNTKYEEFLSDVNVLGALPDQVLTWTGTEWIAQYVTITIDGTDTTVANSSSPFIVWDEDATLPNAKTIVGDGFIGINTNGTNDTVELYMIDPTISGVSLGSNLYGLTFGTGFDAGIFDDYDGSSAVKLDIDFGLGINQVARGNHTHTLDQLEDVAITNATEGDVVVYSGTEGWVNRNFIYGGSASSFAN